jgi:hypothetical protein
MSKGTNSLPNRLVFTSRSAKNQTPAVTGQILSSLAIWLKA